MDKEGNEISLLMCWSSETDSVLDEVDLKLQIRKLYDKMQSVLKQKRENGSEMRYGLINGKNKTQEKLLRILGISRSYVSRIEKSHNEPGQEFNSDGFGIG